MKKLLLFVIVMLCATGCSDDGKAVDSVSTQMESAKVATGQYEVTLNGETYKANVVSDKITLTNGTKSYELEIDEFDATSLEIEQLSSSEGQKNIMISAPTGGSSGIVISAVLKLNKDKDVIELDRDVFSLMNNASFYDLDSKVKDNILHDWIANQHMGFHTADFDDFKLVKENNGTVRFRLGERPIILTGSAKVHFDFDSRKFQLDEIDKVSFEDIKGSSWCENVKEQDDAQYGKILAVDNSQGYKSILEGGNVYNLVGCGESLDRPLAAGRFYLIEAIIDYDKSATNSLLDTLLTYRVKTDIKDENGNSAYTVALIKGITDETILGRLREGLSKSNIIQAERTETLLMHGNDLTIDELDHIIHDGENSVSVNSNISFYTSGRLYSTETNNWTGTALGNALDANNVKQIEWLLKNGADPNIPMGDYEFSVSPLKYSLESDDLTIAEKFLKYGADGDELVPMMPGRISLNAYFKESPEITRLLSKYGFNKWYLEDPDSNLKLDTREEIMGLITLEQ
ncbi:hypothetical protein [Cohnella mopanensis]|uniref:hypothetical protein n=1 Tax=Cohnella mopanensis TaxID=2911966 RepID=UPI001EF87080|nr:hypothetical protein [Cohnella mopanensis]